MSTAGPQRGAAPARPWPGASRRARVIAALPFLALLALLASTTPGGAATAPVTVTVTVPSATSISINPTDPAPAGSCLSGTNNVTNLGAVLPGATTVSSQNCVVVFGSSNDTSMLRLYQADQYGTAMALDQFTAQVSGSTSTINEVDVVSAQQAWITGNTRLVKYTTDGGTTWNNPPAALPGTFGNMQAIDAVDMNKVYVVGLNGNAAVTSNGGTAWTDISGPVGGGANSLTGVAAINTQTAVIVGMAGIVTRTDDGGTTWTPQTPCSVGQDYWAIQALDTQTMWITGTGSSVCKTTNGGTTWVTKNTGLASTQLRGLSVVDANVVWVAGHNGEIARTTDGGTTWTTWTVGGGAWNFRQVYATSRTTAWGVGDNGVIYRTTDGVTWQDITPSGATQRLEGVEGIGNDIWAVGGSGAVQELWHTPSQTVPDYDDVANNDWGTANASAFGACLESIAGGAAVNGTTWQTNAGCPATDGVGWNKIVTTSGSPGAKIASGGAAGNTSAEVHLRFGFRAAPTQKAGTYLAPVVFEVLAPYA